MMVRPDVVTDAWKATLLATLGAASLALREWHLGVPRQSRGGRH